MMARRKLQEILMSVALIAIVSAVLFKTTEGQECDFYITDKVNYVFSPNFNLDLPYPRNATCRWLFESTPGKKIRLIFTFFELEPTTHCNADYVLIYDGASEDDPVSGKFCGKNKPDPILSLSTHRMLMVFRSDRSYEYKGFHALYSATGCDHFINTTDGVVTSPNYPGIYQTDTICTWEFETSPTARIKLVFESFLLETSDECKFDYVDLYDGATVKDPRVGKFCGSSIPQPIISSGHKILMVFKSDSSENFSGFRVLHTTEFFRGISEEERRDIERDLIQHLLSTRRRHMQAISNWGMDITRTAVALFLSEPRFFAAGNGTGEDIAYELTLQLMSKLVTRKRVSSKDLALFINALTVACINPKKFFGINIVSELRRRVDNSNRTNPFFILALCIGGGQMKTKDGYKLQELFRAHLRHPHYTGTQAMAFMALKCLSRQPNMNFNDSLTEMVTELKKKQQPNGAVDNLENTALVVQALLATESYLTNFNLTLAMKSIMREVRQPYVSTEEVYYVLPLLKHRTLLNVNSYHCESFTETELEEIKDLEATDNPDEQIRVQISIIIGDDADFSRTWRLTVPPHYSFYQVLQNISSSDPGNRVRYTFSEGKPYVAGLAGFKDSTAEDAFWFIYTKSLSTADDPVLVEDSPADIQVNESNEIILWYRSEQSSTTQDVSYINLDTPL